MRIGTFGSTKSSKSSFLVELQNLSRSRKVDVDFCAERVSLTFFLASMLLAMV